jgi:hypothetical protein
MLMERAAGASLTDLAAKYRVSTEIVDEIMTEAWQDGVVERLQEKLYTELSPLAMATYEAQLKMGNLDAARDVLGTVGVIQRPSTRGQAAKEALQRGFAAAQMNAGAPTAAPQDIEGYRLSRQQRRYVAPGSGRRIDLGTDDGPRKP